MIPILWVCGPPGVGKTAVAWEIYQRLQGAGAEPAYVDVDQLGICYPPPAEDPDRHTLKARNVAALRTNFAAAGARTLIVSGVVDAGRGPDVDALSGQPVVTVRLRADPAPLRARLRTRDGSSSPLHEAAVAEAEALDRAAFAAVCIDTTQLTIDETTTRVLGEIGDWPRPGRQDAPSSDSAADAHPGGEVLWVTGPTGVGKSAVGFRAYLDILSSGACAAYVDTGQIGFCAAAPDNHALRARNLAVLWRNFHDAGARAAIVVGHVDTPSETLLYEQALPGARLSWRRLRAGETELTRRILSRGGGGGWSEPGDRLRGRPRGELLAVADRAIAESRRLDQHDLGLVVDVDSLDPGEAAKRLLAHWRAGSL